MMVSGDVFISTAQKFLCCGKKRRIARSSCLDLAVQMLAVDSGLKAAVLYDLNAACAEQIRRYAVSLRDAGELATALQIVSIDGNCLVVNNNRMKEHLSDVLKENGVLVMDVCAAREQPSLCLMDNNTKRMVRDMLDFITEGEDERASVSVVTQELYGRWNLCTLFGILLGFPASYWFDQENGGGNCLSLTPLLVNKVWVCCSFGDTNLHRSCLYSFSVPEVLQAEAQAGVETWMERLRRRFVKQNVLTELSVCKETVLLHSVAL